MARTKYTSEVRDQIAVRFIAAAREIIETEGIEGITVRKIASLANCNSAKLYFYFKDLDEVITMASMSYLEKYTRTLVNDLAELPTNYDIFMHTWEVFSVYAFNNPTMFYQIFFTHHSTSLKKMIEEYYRLFPYQFSQVNESIKRMLFSGSLQERNLEILKLLAEEDLIDEENMELINELMLSYFYSLLRQRMQITGGLIEMERFKNRFMHSLHFLLDQKGNQNN